MFSRKMIQRAEQIGSRSLGERPGLYGGCSRTSPLEISQRLHTLPTRQMRLCEISGGKSLNILRIAPTLLQATSICSALTHAAERFPNDEPVERILYAAGFQGLVKSLNVQGKLLFSNQYSHLSSISICNLLTYPRIFLGGLQSSCHAFF
jgi:hypothetical protein